MENSKQVAKVESDRKGRARLRRISKQPTTKVKAAAQGGTIGSAVAALVTAIATGGDVDAAAGVLGACLGTTAAAFVLAYVRRAFAGE